MEQQSITIALEDESRGYAISPDRVPLALLSSFTEEVQAFLRGTDKEPDLKEIEVAVISGSYAYVTAPMYAPALFRDLDILQQSSDLSQIDPKRRTIMAAWQASAKTSIGRAIRIGKGDQHALVMVNSTTNYRDEAVEHWVEVERYVQGELQDLGGATTSNAHIKLPDGKTLVVRTNKDLIRAEKDNHVYKPVRLRIRAKYNIETHELKDASLIEFVDYAPAFDAEAFRLATENGAKAWADVEDPAAWIRRLRGVE